MKTIVQSRRREADERPLDSLSPFDGERVRVRGSVMPLTILVTLTLPVTYGNLW